MRSRVIDHGRMVQRGRPRELYDHPANEFVATFLGEANLFGGVVADAGNDSSTCARDRPPAAWLRSVGLSTAGQSVQR